MQGSTINPDTRPLPPGWREHFDQRLNLWYYVDLESVPLRASFEHPASHVSYAPGSCLDSAEGLDPPPSISFLTSPDASSGTFAQKLYASSICSLRSLDPSPNPLFNHPSSTNPMAEDASLSEFATPFVRVTDTSSSSPSPLMSLPSATVSNSGSAQRSRKARNLTFPGVSGGSPFGLTSPPLTGDSITFYNHSVATAPLLGNRPLPIGPRPHHRRASSANDNPTGQNHSTKPFPALPSVGTKRHDGPSTLAPAKYPTRKRSGTSPGLYPTVTQDNLDVIPQHGSSSMATMSTAVSKKLAPHPQDDLPRPVSSDHVVILQPKPVRPLKGVGLKLQDQLATMTLEAAATDQTDRKMKKKKQRSLIMQRLLGIAS